MLESCNWEMPVTTFNQDTDSRGRRVFFILQIRENSVKELSSVHRCVFSNLL